jgi:LPXTG-motif cell wall-anchored protein
MARRVGARRRLNIGFAFVVLVVGMLGGAFALFEPAAQASYCSGQCGSTTTAPESTSSTSTSTSTSTSSTSTSTSTTVPQETTTTVPEESTTTIIKSETTIFTTTTLGEQGTVATTTTDPVEVPGQLPRTGSGSAAVAIFALLSIAAGGLMILGRRKPWIRS